MTVSALLGLALGYLVYCWLVGVVGTLLYLTFRSSGHPPSIEDASAARRFRWYLAAQLPERARPRGW